MLRQLEAMCEVDPQSLVGQTLIFPDDLEHGILRNRKVMVAAVVLSKTLFHPDLEFGHYAARVELVEHPNPGAEFYLDLGSTSPFTRQLIPRRSL